MGNFIKIDWKRKLTSRKFWLAVIGFVTAIMQYAGASENSIAQITSIIMEGAVLVAYMVAEGLADAGNLALQEIPEIHDEDNGT